MTHEKGQKVKIKADGNPDHPDFGKIATVEEVWEPKTERSYTVKIEGKDKTELYYESELAQPDTA